MEPPINIAFQVLEICFYIIYKWFCNLLVLSQLCAISYEM